MSFALPRLTKATKEAQTVAGRSEVLQTRRSLPRGGHTDPGEGRERDADRSRINANLIYTTNPLGDSDWDWTTAQPTPTEFLLDEGTLGQNQIPALSGAEHLGMVTGA